MRIIDPFEENGLQGARAYSSALNVLLFDEAKKNGAIFEFEQNILREWKVLLLTKNTLTTGASAMISDFGYKLFSKYPILLEKEMVLPTVGNHVIGQDWKNGGDNEKVSGYYVERLKNCTETYKKEVTSFFKDNIKTGVGWDLESNTSNFQQKFIDGLKNENSVLRANLKNISSSNINQLIKTLSQSSETFSRAKINQAITSNNIGEKDSIVLFKFQELLYNMSGAGVVNCESSLPQENFLLDFSIADIENRKIILSEKLIFCKIFFELYFESMLQTTAIPYNALDVLTFEDIAKIRKDFQDSSFVEAYNTIISEVAGSFLNKNDDVFYNIQQLHKIKQIIEERYNEIFGYVRRLAKQKGLIDSIGHQNTNLGLGLTNFVDTGTLSGIKAPNISFLMDTTSIYLTSQNMSHENDRLERLAKNLINAPYLETIKHSDKQGIIEFATEIHRTIASRLSNKFGFKY